MNKSKISSSIYSDDERNDRIDDLAQKLFDVLDSYGHDGKMTLMALARVLAVTCSQWKDPADMRMRFNVLVEAEFRYRKSEAAQQ